MDSATGRQRGSVLLCYDGSDAAGRAIERAGAALAGGPAVVLTLDSACVCFPDVGGRFAWCVSRPAPGTAADS